MQVWGERFRNFFHAVLERREELIYPQRALGTGNAATAPALREELSSAAEEETIISEDEIPAPASADDWNMAGDLDALAAPLENADNGGGEAAEGLVLPTTNLDDVGGIFGTSDTGEDDPPAAETPKTSAEAGDWQTKIYDYGAAKLRTLYKKIDKRVNFKKNWYLIVDGVALIMMAISGAIIAAYFLYYR
jgi:hypothetical protein